MAIVSQSGRKLLDPWIIFVHVPESFSEVEELRNMVEKNILEIPLMTEDIIKGKTRIF